MKVHFVGAGPGAADLLTVRAMRLLQTCRVCVYAGSLVSPDVLSLLPDAAERHDSAGIDLQAIIAICQDARDRDLDVIRLHSGDPSLYGAIREQMRELEKLGIAYEVVPGVSSFQAAAAAVKTELTAPEVAQTVILTRAAGRTPLPREQELGQLARSGATLCIFLSVQSIRQVVSDLVEHYGGECPVAVVYHASWPDQKVVVGVLGDIAGKVAEAGVERTAIIIVGRALQRDLPASKLYDAEFSHGYRTRDQG